MLALRIRTFNKAQAVTLVTLLVLTTVFDSIIVGLGIVGYDPSKILGIFVGFAPIEDFFYAILAAVMIPAIWHILEKRHDQRN
jgi:lycopene cyclase domain-containing protein